VVDPPDEITFSIAARFGHLHILQWLRKRGTRWDEMTCSEAAYGGHLEVLKWARKNGCPWYKWYCYELAVGCSHSHVTEWIQESHDNS